MELEYLYSLLIQLSGVGYSIHDYSVFSSLHCECYILLYSMYYVPLLFLMMKLIYLFRLAQFYLDRACTHSLFDPNKHLFQTIQNIVFLVISSGRRGWRRHNVHYCLSRVNHPVIYCAPSWVATLAGQFYSTSNKKLCRKIFALTRGHYCPRHLHSFVWFWQKPWNGYPHWSWRFCTWPRAGLATNLVTSCAINEVWNVYNKIS